MIKGDRSLGHNADHEHRTQAHHMRSANGPKKFGRREAVAAMQLLIYRKHA